MVHSCSTCCPVPEYGSKCCTPPRDLRKKNERSSQLHASVSGGRCRGYFGAAEGQHTRIAPVWNIVPHFKVGVEESPLPKVPLGTAAVRGCWHSRLYQALSMRCNGRREHYLPFLGGNGCPTSSIILFVRGVIVEFLCSPLAPCGTHCVPRPGGRLTSIVGDPNQIHPLVNWII